MNICVLLIALFLVCSHCDLSVSVQIIVAYMCIYIFRCIFSIFKTSLHSFHGYYLLRAPPRIYVSAEKIALHLYEHVFRLLLYFLCFHIVIFLCLQFANLCNILICFSAFVPICDLVALNILYYYCMYMYTLCFHIVMYLCFEN